MKESKSSKLPLVLAFIASTILSSCISCFVTINVIKNNYSLVNDNQETNKETQKQNIDNKNNVNKKNEYNLNYSSLLERLYSDNELASFKNSSLSIEDAKNKFSTIADIVAYLDLFNAKVYSPSLDNTTVETAYNNFIKSGSVTAYHYAIVTSYLLSDDIDNLYTIISNNYKSDYNKLWAFCGIALPTKSGYTIMSPASLSSNLHNNNCVPMLITETNVDSNFTNIQNIISFDSSILSIQQIMLIDSNTTSYEFIDNEFYYSFTSNNIKNIYLKNSEDLEQEKQDITKAKIEANYKTAINNYNRYGINGFNEFSNNQTFYEYLATLSADEAQKEIDSVDDLIGFFCFKNYTAQGHDLNIRDDENNLWWHFNCEPYNCFAHNYGCCGTTSGLVNFLLANDYEEIGMCNMTFTHGEGGGHVINYYKDGNTYYVCDFVNLVSTGYSVDGFCVATGSTLNEACLNWIEKCHWNVQVFITTYSTTGDIPIGWGNDCYTSYFPTQLEDTITIQYENKDKGYSVVFINMSDSMAEQIKSYRSRSDVTGLQ